MSKFMKILITGGSGFIGTSLVKKALEDGNTVLNLDCLTYASSEESLKQFNSNKSYYFENINICNKKKLSIIFKEFEPDAVMHLAAESHVDNSIKTPIEFIETNIVGTFNTLEASRSYWSKKKFFNEFRFHHVSTDEVYGSLGETGTFNESTPYNPRSPYSASKASSDHLVRAWHNTFKLPTLITNCSNNYGPYQFPEKLIPLIIKNALIKKPIPIYGDGSNIRDWLYVEDHAVALLTVLKNGIIGETYNIGSENEISNLDLALKICEVLNHKKLENEFKYESLITFVEDRPGHDERYSINPTKIRSELNWNPKFNIDEGIKKTVLWYLSNQDWVKSIEKSSSIKKQV